MVELVDMGSPKAVGMKISGKIEKPDIEKVFAVIDEKLKQSEKLAIYVEVEKFGGMSLEALWEDFKLGLPKIKKFEKKAVVSDSQWHKLFTEIGDKLFPSVEAKHFLPEQREEAMAWIIA